MSRSVARTAPVALSCRLPAEWERHAATWLIWPHDERDWPNRVGTVRWTFVEMIRRIAAGESVRLLFRNAREEAEAGRMLAQAGVPARRIQPFRCPTERAWVRDTGPLWIRRDGGRAIVDFHFNAWALYPDWQRDRKIAGFAARRLGVPRIEATAGGRPFVLEGGGVDGNGRGDILTTEECYLHPRVQIRNPGLDRAGFERGLRDFLGAKQVIWLPRGIAGDDTHGHIDDFCRFVGPRTIVIARAPRGDRNARALDAGRERLRGARLADGSRPEIVELPMPAPLRFAGRRLPASYANFYFANACLLVPTFNDPADRIALGILAELVRDRPVIGLHAVDLVLGGGSVHCLTQQEPEAAPRRR